MYFDNNTSYSLLPYPPPLPYPSKACLFFFFLTHGVQLVLSIFLWMYGLAFECGRHTGDHTLKENCLPLSQLLSIASRSLAGVGFYAHFPHLHASPACACTGLVYTVSNAMNF